MSEHYSALTSKSCLLIALEESFKAEPYLCSEGYPTVGYGQRIGPKGADITLYQFTLPRCVATRWLTSTVVTLLEHVTQHPQLATAFARCDATRQCILLSMAYQMGVNGLTHFSKMLAALEVGNWQEAHTQALDSRWAEQTPARAARHAHTLLTGELL